MKPCDKEKDLAEKLLGKKNMKDLKYLAAPLPLILFCLNGNRGFKGDDLGMIAKACNDFFPMPTDNGICFSKNTDIKEVMRTESAYDDFLSTYLQKSNEYIIGGTSENKLSLAFFIGGGEKSMYPTDSKTMKHDREEIQLKIHSPNVLANFFEDNALISSTLILTLKEGYEYFIDVTPQVVSTTDAFKNMGFQQRKCKLSNEIPDGSIFKNYTMKNCQYECNIKKAETLCKCIPWDFMHNTQAKECDLFGRTCFYNAMKNLTKSNQFYCKDCIKECDHTTYETKITSKKEITKNEIAGGMGNYKAGACTGQRVFCNFLLPKNGTHLIDNGVVNAHEKLTLYGSFNKSRLQMLDHMVIVHLRILNPNIQRIDAKYSISDKFANFGGNFGIFAEITGCSFLGILNFFIILFKLIFSLPCQNVK